MDAHRHHAESPHGLTDRIARWAGLRGSTAPVEDPSSARMQEARGAFSREIDRRRRQYDEVGSFMMAHDLDLTPLNFGFALDYITGNDHRIEKAVQSVLLQRGRITNGWVEQIVAQRRADEVTPESLAEMLDKVEANLGEFTTLIDESRTHAKDYGAALQEQVRDLDHDDAAHPILGKLVALTRSMVEKTRQAEAQMRDNQKQTRLLQQSLESARRAAEHDHLTGLPNRRAFEARLAEEHAAATKAGEDLSIAFCDIDHFKLVNDTHGHDTGDRVLKFVASLLAKISGDKCCVARHGGEEFVVLFRGKSAAEACKIVDDAREDLSTRSLVNRTSGERLDRVTFSGGVANVLAYDDPRAALKAADRALYLAKEHGRNRVYVAAETS
ncbi:GGDEF domain-containing protein [Sphingobium sp. H39-3-25]|uniref:GGDEF domain-containing protein n=1 Tax=Sphingobium arseniciresistens TaxID=3030834 RepID=UPI0023B93C24|nr:GGDEF domain-containing protein [Sphingobium arseniciresistens]